VLVALACGELVISDKGKIGDVLRDQTEPLRATERDAYTNLKGSDRNALVLKMLNKGMAVLKGKTNKGSVRFVEASKAPEAEKDPQGFLNPEQAPGLEPGNAVFDAEQARSFELANGKANSRQELATALNLSPASLREDLLLGRTAHPWVIEVRGDVTQGLINDLERQVRKAVARGANLIILQLESEGGDSVVARSFAETLRTLKDDKGQLPVKTIAYIPPHKSLGVGTFLALGCTEIVMAKDSFLGDFENLREKSADELNLKRESLVGLARDQGYPELLFQGMLDRDLSVVRVRSRKDPNEYRLLTQSEYNEDQKQGDNAKWVIAGQIKSPGGFKKLDAETAKEQGVARYVVSKLDDLYERYGLDPSQVKTSRRDWLAQVADFFQLPLVRVFLVMIGIAGLILELKMPGVGLPGVVAAVCFVLFFWAQSFTGQFTLLAVLLFVLGLILIGLEVFVLPGLGVTGISGIVLVVGSLVLATLEKMPETTAEWLGLGATLTTFGMGLVAAIAAAFVLAWYLPHIPYANRLMLQPPGENADPLADSAPGGEPAGQAALLGAIGVAATTLRPAGKARFGDDYLDVIAEGSYVTAGTRVQVIEIEGNRIVVKEV
jgi:membrane-bound ClpP family serine protease